MSLPFRGDAWSARAGLPPYLRSSQRCGMPVASIIEFAVVCLTSIRPSIVFGGIITLWTIVALPILTEG